MIDDAIFVNIDFYFLLKSTNKQKRACSIIAYTICLPFYNPVACCKYVQKEN